MTKKKKDALFASDGSQAEVKKTRELALSRRAELLERLIRNPDFKEWMFGVLYTLCAFENDLRDTTEFERGIRAAGSLIRRELLPAMDAPAFFAELELRYFAGVRCGILDNQKKANEEGVR